MLSEIEKRRCGIEVAPTSDGSVKKNEESESPLFEKKGRVVIERLKSLNITSLTPLDALNCLDELKKELLV